MNKLESEIQKEILEWLRASGYKTWKNYLGPLLICGGRRARNPNSGQPDIYGIFKNKPGKMFAIEIKSYCGKLSEQQRREILELETSGVFVIAARTLSVVKSILEREDIKDAS